MPPLDKARAQMDVEEVKQVVAREQQVGTKASPPFPVTPREVVIAADLYGKAAECHVAVASSIKLTVLPEAVTICAQLGSDSAGLVEFRAPILHVENFLQRHYIGIELCNDFRDALRIAAPVQASTLVNVVAGNPNAEAHCSRSKIQPTISISRSDSGRAFHSSSVTFLDSPASCSKSRVSLLAICESSTATLTSSLMPNERLSRLVEPTTLHAPSKIAILAWIMDGSYSYTVAPALRSLP